MWWVGACPVWPPLPDTSRTGEACSAGRGGHCGGCVCIPARARTPAVVAAGRAGGSVCRGDCGDRAKRRGRATVGRSGRRRGAACRRRGRCAAAGAASARPFIAGRSGHRGVAACRRPGCGEHTSMHGTEGSYNAARGAGEVGRPPADRSGRHRGAACHRGRRRAATGAAGARESDGRSGHVGVAACHRRGRRHNTAQNSDTAQGKCNVEGKYNVRAVARAADEVGNQLDQGGENVHSVARAMDEAEKAGRIRRVVPDQRPHDI